jgi:Mlc titration factor MtfA (ptsG expression regulator)
MLLPLLSFFLIRFRKKQKEQKALRQAFPQEWRSKLEIRVPFYKNLTPEEKSRFEKQVQAFLYRTRITGINTEIEDDTRLWIATSAIIPIFGFKDWQYRNLQEVLVYPGSFKSDDFAQKGPDRSTLGMVGTGPMRGKMILSKPALVNGFIKNSDGYNTGIHEFVHLLDGSDGDFDGIPHLLEQKYVLPWLGLMHREMKRIQKGKSKLRAYGATNKAEFFAVASEFFFERPDELRLQYPKLYNLLRRIFRQDLSRQFSPAILRKLKQ